jgi:hypothetical protein
MRSSNVNPAFTAGALAYKASNDSTKFDSLEVGHALTEDIAKELAICAQRHRTIFDEDEYCVGYVIAGDPLIKNLMRRKFFAFLYLPSPRPNQSVFLYNKRLDQFTKRLWTLPNAWTMACLSELTYVDKPWREMKGWCDAFYGLKFWEHVRKQHNISMLSEIEYLNANREKLIKAGCQETKSLGTDPFDFSKVTVDKIVNPEDSLVKQ